MDHDDFIKLIGSSEEAEYVPVAFLLRSGYGCAGYYNAKLNDGLNQTVALVNARIIELRESSDVRGMATITSFNEFLEEVVTRFYRQSTSSEQGIDDDADQALDTHGNDIYGKSIPLVTIPLNEIAVLYPVARISDLMRRAKDESVDQTSSVPTFLDFDNKSVVLKILRSKPWQF